MGKLVAFEGIDRAGKSSVIEQLKAMIRDCRVPITVCGEFHSPLTPIVREALHSGGSPFLKTYLFACDRAWTYEKVGLPALQRGELVLWDRYVDSALVYRAVELSTIQSEIDLEFVKLINRPFQEPDLTIYIDVSINTASLRAKRAGKKEPYDFSFLSKVRSEYLKLAPKRGYCVINGELPFDEVVGKVEQAIREHLKELFL
jgi:dTMP kinase